MSQVLAVIFDSVAYKLAIYIYIYMYVWYINYVKNRLCTYSQKTPSISRSVYNAV